MIAASTKDMNQSINARSARVEKGCIDYDPVPIQSKSGKAGCNPMFIRIIPIAEFGTSLILK